MSGLQQTPTSVGWVFHWGDAWLSLGSSDRTQRCSRSRFCIVSYQTSGIIDKMLDFTSSVTTTTDDPSPNPLGPRQDPWLLPLWHFTRHRQLVLPGIARDLDTSLAPIAFFCGDLARNRNFPSCQPCPPCTKAQSDLLLYKCDR